MHFASYLLLILTLLCTGLSSCKHDPVKPPQPPTVTPAPPAPPVDARCRQLADQSYQGPIVFRYRDGRGIGVANDHDQLMLNSQPRVWMLKSGSWQDQRGYWIFSDETLRRAWVPSNCTEPWKGNLGLYWNHDHLARGLPEDCELLHVVIKRDCQVTLRVNYQGYYVSFLDGLPAVSTTGTEFTAEFPAP